MAEGIPYPQAPQMTVQNPLQNISNLQALDQRQQAIAQQEMQMRAKMAVGRHMQANIDPQTGQLRNTDFLTSLAADPDAGPGFMEVLQGLHQLGEVDARTLGLQLQNKQKEMDIASNLFIPMLDKVRSGKGVTKSELWGLAGQAVSKGLYKDSNAAINAFMQMTGSIPDSDDARADLVRRMAMSNENGRQALSANMLDAKSALAPVETMQDGVPGKIPAYETPFVPQGTRELYGQPATETTVEGASAPRPSPSVREGASPSAPPPASTFVRSGQSPEEQAAIGPYIQYQKGEGPMREFEQMVNNKAETSQAVLQRLEETERVLQKFKTGPLTKARFEAAKLAEGFGLKNLAERLQRGDVAAAQEFEKLTTRNAFEELKTALGGQGRFTNLEVENFMRSNFNLETMPEAIQDMMNFTKKITDLAAYQQEQFSKYKTKSFENKRNENSFNPGYFSNKFMQLLKKEGRIKEGLYHIKQEGEQ